MTFMFLWWLTAWLPVAASPANAQPSARDALIEEVRAWAGAQASVNPDRVEVGPLDGRMRVGPCTTGAKFDFPFAARDLIRARCDAPAWQVFIRVSIRLPQQRVMAARALVAGRPLVEADLAVGPADDPTGAGFEQRSAVIGRIPRRDVPAGRLLIAQDLDDAIRVVRITRALRAGAPVAADAVLLEVVPRGTVPAGTLLSALPADGARLLRDVAPGHLLRVDDVSATRRVLVARGNLVAGSPVEAGMFEPGTIDSRDPAQAFIADLAGLELAELTRNLQAGEALRVTDVRAGVLVRRGQPVMLTAGAGDSVQVTVRTEALQDARLGEQVQLRNPESGRILSGVVTGRGTARGL